MMADSIARIRREFRFAVLPLALIILTATANIAAAGFKPIKIAGDRHTLFLLDDGSVVGFGPCDWGQLGPIAAIPQRRNWATALVSIKLPRKAIDIAAGDASSFALLDDGTVVAWGSNYKNLLGNGAASAKATLPDGKNGSEVPVRINGLTDIVRIDAAGGMAVALRRDGTLLNWGNGFSSPTPTRVSGPSKITAISVSGSHAMALDASGNVWTWGDNLYGALGRATNSPDAAVVPGITGVVSIAAGNGVSTVVKNDGTVWVWGSNYQAQFGNGDRTNAPVTGGLSNDITTTPAQVPGVRNAVMATSGVMGRHTLALLRDGTIRGWGNTDWGQIGAGVSGTFQESPVVPKITGVKTLWAVQNNSYALKTDGTFWMWGTGWNGEFPLKVNVKIPKMMTF